MPENAFIKTDWYNQIKTLAQNMCPCKHNELLFHAIQLVPHAVSRNLFRRRRHLAATVISRVCKTTDGDCILRPASEKPCGMKGTIFALKQQGNINPLDYMKAGTANTYCPILRRLQWIEVQGDGSWQWTGPDDADHQIALRQHRPRKTNQ